MVKLYEIAREVYYLPSSPPNRNATSPLAFSMKVRQRQMLGSILQSVED